MNIDHGGVKYSSMEYEMVRVERQHGRLKNTSKIGDIVIKCKLAL